jgi:hypothetical protein
VDIRLICPDCRSWLEPGDEPTLRCIGCGRHFEVNDDVALLGPAADSEQHAHQRRYFDGEFSHYAAYDIENWRASFIERIFAALGFPRQDGAYLDVGVGGSGATVIEAARLGMTAVGCDLSIEGVLRARAFAAGQGVDSRASFLVCAPPSVSLSKTAYSPARARWQCSSTSRTTASQRATSLA